MTGRWVHPASGRSYHEKFAPPKVRGGGARTRTGARREADRWKQRKGWANPGDLHAKGDGCVGLRLGMRDAAASARHWLVGPIPDGIGLVCGWVG